MLHVHENVCHSLHAKSCLQDLVAFEMVATPLNAPFALAAHLPPNLTTLKLQYLPAATWPPDDIPPDGLQVCLAHLHLLTCHRSAFIDTLSYVL